MALPKTFTPEVKGKYTMKNLKSEETVKIRIMTDFITGRSVWSGMTKEDRKPFRVPPQTAIPTDKIGVNLFTGYPENIKQFIAAVCWNYKTEQFEIFETDKSSIIESIFTFEGDEDFGDSKNYDLKISKKGTGMETKYNVLAIKSDLDKSIIENFKKQNIDLTALYRGEDPFKTEEVVITDSKAQNDFVDTVKSSLSTDLDDLPL